MKHLALASVAMYWAVLAACGDDGGTSLTGDAAISGDSGGGNADAAVPVDPLPGIGNVELVDNGYMFTEGPQWRDTEGDLLFSDIPANTIYRYVPGGGDPVSFRSPSGNSNGIALDGDGAVITAEHGSRSIRRDGVLVVGTFEGNDFNSPNDVIVHGDGTMYFTDPDYGLAGRPREISFNGVYRLQTNGTVTAEHMGAPPNAQKPNGIGISPDGNTIYVADTQEGRLWRFARNADGSLQPRAMHAVTSGGGDGLAVDVHGNIFVTTTAGIDVFSPTGHKWGTIDVPMQPANCAFGDVDHKTLYITARTALYKVRLANAGLPRN